MIKAAQPARMITFEITACLLNLHAVAGDEDIFTSSLLEPLKQEIGVRRFVTATFMPHCLTPDVVYVRRLPLWHDAFHLIPLFSVSSREAK